MGAVLTGPSGSTQHVPHGPARTNQGRDHAEPATHRTRVRRCHPSTAQSVLGQSVRCHRGREVTPSWVQGPSAPPDPRRGNCSPNSHVELLKTSQHTAGAARTVSAINKASHRAQGARAHQLQSTERHLGWEKSHRAPRLLCPMGSSRVRAALPGCQRSSQPEAAPAAPSQYSPSGGGSGSGTTWGREDAEVTIGRCPHPNHTQSQLILLRVQVPL